MGTSTVSLKHVGRVELNDLIGMCPGKGDGLPYPLWRTKRESYWGDAEKALPPLPDRFGGDLRSLREWVQTYWAADILVECRVQSFTPEIAGVRLLAHRAGEIGFIGVQRPQVDAVDVYRLSAMEVGPAVAALSGLVQPGARSAIRIPGFLDNFIGDAQQKSVATFEDDESQLPSIRERPVPRGHTTTISDYNDIQLMATVQSRCQPRSIRGVDWRRDAVVWLRIKEDGDYVYAPDYKSAVPIVEQTLRVRIDQLIAADVAALRQRRGRA